MTLSLDARRDYEDALADPRIWAAIRAEALRYAKHIVLEGGTGDVLIRLRLRNREYMGYRAGAEGAERRAG